MRRAGRMTVVAAAFAVLLPAAACGSRVDGPSALGTVSSADVQDAAEMTERPPVVEAAPDLDRVEGEEPESPPGEPVAVPDEGESVSSTDVDDGDQVAESRTIALELDTEPRCVTPGDLMHVRIETEPRAELSMVVGHADGRPHGQMGFARASDEGIHVWRWAVGPQVPPGTATVLVQSWSEDGQRGASGTDEFVVAGPEGCS